MRCLMYMQLFVLVHSFFFFNKFMNYDPKSHMQANPPQLHSNLLYIQRYRRQSRLVSEAAYYFTNILSAESFIWNIDAKSLSMDETEFQSKMDSAKASLLGLPSNTEIQRNPGNKDDLKFETPRLKRDTGAHQDKKNLSVFDLEKKGAADILKDERPNKYFQEFPFLFAHAGDLTVDDVEGLLNNYKQLVFKYASLCKGLGTSAASTSGSSTDAQENVDSGKNTVDDIEAEMKKLELEGFGRNDESSENLVLNPEHTGSKIAVDVSASHENMKEDV
jgi:Rab5 GDP/GTP exchange factor